MTAVEFQAHFEDWQRGEWGERRADARAALICQQIVTMAGKSIKEGTQVKLSDFLLEFGKAEPEKDPDPSSFFRKFG